jgi:hypothetical protein
MKGMESPPSMRVVRKCLSDIWAWKKVGCRAGKQQPDHPGVVPGSKLWGDNERHILHGSKIILIDLLYFARISVKLD